MTVTVTKDSVDAEYSKYVRDLLKDFRIPGFRRGMVPQAVLERKAGDALKMDVLSHIISDTLKSFFDDPEFPAEFVPLSYADPELEGDPKLELGSDLAFSVVYDVKPKIENLVYEGHSVEVPQVKITDADIARELERIRERNAVVMDRGEDERSQKGDVVTVNYAEIDENGQAAAQREGFVFQLGSGRNIYQFDDEITGMKTNEEREFEKSYPKDYKYPELAGSKVKLRVKVTSVKKKDLPALDDDLAQDVSEKFKTLADLKKDLRSKMENQLAERLGAIKKDLLLKKIAESAKVEVPVSMTFYETSRMLSHNFTAPISEGPDSEAFEKARGDSQARITENLVAIELQNILKIEAAEADIENEYQKMADEFGGSVEELKSKFEQSPGTIDMLKQRILEDKLFEALEKKNTIKEGKKQTYLDIFPENM
jgi:trigger factor